MSLGPDTVNPMPDGRPLYYVLEEDGSVRPWKGSIVGWSDRMMQLGANKTIRETNVGGTSVITAFLGMDDAAATLRPAKKPDIFGTFVWGTRQEFFNATKKGAIARHERIVARLQAGRTLKGEYRNESEGNEEGTEEGSEAK